MKRSLNVKSQDYKIAKISLLISRQETMGKVRIDMNESKSNDDHTNVSKQN